MTEETPEIDALRKALEAYGLANRVREGDIGVFIEACFEKIDNGPLEDWAETDEDLIYQAQEPLVIAKYGKGAWAAANTGCLVDGDDDTTTVWTKIYRRGTPYLRSTINHKTKEITHEWE